VQVKDESVVVCGVTSNLVTFMQVATPPTTTAPPGGVPTGHYLMQVNLPLDASEVQELVADLTQGRELSVDQAGHISELSDGIPFFVEELAAHEGRGLPSSLNGLMQHRLDNLPQAAQDLLAAVATSGTLVDVADLGAVLDASDDEIGDALDECVSRGLLDVAADGDFIGFRHALLAEAVLASLLPQVRRSWHRRQMAAIDKRGVIR